ncbi:hypothetical protein HWV62_24472 [Athelia sp. TMB]|nr:hypothetical protein HWV62_24472 [Athelia sp. TMB]
MASSFSLSTGLPANVDECFLHLVSGQDGFILDLDKDMAELGNYAPASSSGAVYSESGSHCSEVDGYKRLRPFTPDFLAADYEPPSPPGSAYARSPTPEHLELDPECIERSLFPPSYQHLYRPSHPCDSSTELLLLMRTRREQAKAQMKEARESCISEQRGLIIAEQALAAALTTAPSAADQLAVAQLAAQLTAQLDAVKLATTFDTSTITTASDVPPSNDLAFAMASDVPTCTSSDLDFAITSGTPTPTPNDLYMAAVSDILTLNHSSMAVPPTPKPATEETSFVFRQADSRGRHGRIRARHAGTMLSLT